MLGLDHSRAWTHVARLQTFLLAGHETTSTALTWTLHILANKPDVQEKLRKEVRDARAKAKGEGREELEHRELDSLPYLDGVTVRFDVS